MGDFNRIAGRFGVAPQDTEGGEVALERRIDGWNRTVHGENHCPSCLGCGMVSQIEHTVVPKVETGPKGTHTVVEGQTRTLSKNIAVRCPDCEGRGMSPGASNEIRRRKSGIPKNMAERMRFTTLRDNPEMAHIVRHVQAWAKNPTGGVILAGPTGRGKTHLAVASACDIAEAGIDIVFVESRSMLESLRQGIADNTYHKIMSRLKTATGLVLDDFGSERMTDFSEDVFEGVLSHRYELELGFLVTTNLEPSDLSPRLASRMKHEGRVTALNCLGKDWRL